MMTEIKQTIAAPDAPSGRGPFPQAVRTGSLIFLSGQGPLDPATNEPISGSFAEQVQQTFLNVRAILAAAGLGLEHIVKLTVYLSDLAQIPEFNELYEAHMPQPWPARTLVQAGLRQIDIEIDVIAVDPGHALSGVSKP
jgi:2-iminobutanoate/2-iminopropanoate deaminase